MNSNQKLHQAKLYEWAARISDQKASGLTVPCWCEQNHLTIHAYNYWKHQLKQEAVNHMLPEIVPLPLPSDEHALADTPVSDVPHDSANCANRAICATAKLTVNGILLEIDDTVSDEFLSRLIKAASHA